MKYQKTVCILNCTFAESRLGLWWHENQSGQANPVKERS